MIILVESNDDPFFAAHHHLPLLQKPVSERKESDSHPTNLILTAAIRRAISTDAIDSALPTLMNNNDLSCQCKVLLGSPRNPSVSRAKPPQDEEW